MRLICVTLSDSNDWEDHCSSYERAFAAYEFLPFPEDSWKRLTVISGTASSIAISCGISGVIVHRGARIETRVELPRFVFAPIAQGAPLGRVTVYENGREICATELFASSGAKRDDADELSPWRHFWKNWGKRWTGTFHGNEILA